VKARASYLDLSNKTLQSGRWPRQNTLAMGGRVGTVKVCDRPPAGEKDNGTEAITGAAVGR